MINKIPTIRIIKMIKINVAIYCKTLPNKSLKWTAAA